MTSGDVITPSNTSHVDISRDLLTSSAAGQSEFDLSQEKSGAERKKRTSINKTSINHFVPFQFEVTS